MGLTVEIFLPGSLFFSYGHWIKKKHDELAVFLNNRVITQWANTASVCQYGKVKKEARA